MIKDSSIPKKYFEIIDYLITENRERSINQMVQKLSPKNKRHESSVRKKCRELIDLGILTSRRKISKRGTRFKANFFQFNKKMKYEYFKDIARRYLQDEKENKIIFMENNFVQEYIGSAIKKISKDINIPFPKIYLEQIFPFIFSCFPSALYRAISYENRIYKNLKKKGKKPTKEDNENMFSRFLTLIQLDICKDLDRREFLYPEWLSKIHFRPKIMIYYKYDENLNELTEEEIKNLCKKYKIKTAGKNREVLIELLAKKIKSKKIVREIKEPITIESGIIVEF